MNCFTKNIIPNSFVEVAVRSDQSYKGFQYPTEPPGRPPYSAFIGRVNAIEREVAGRRGHTPSNEQLKLFRIEDVKQNIAFTFERLPEILQ
jgi:hypothetical protein